MSSRMPKNKSYVLRVGDKFGIVARAMSFSHSVIVAEIWERNTSHFGLHLVREGTFQPKDLQLAIDFVDGLHLTADGMGKWQEYKTPYQLAREFWPQDYTEPETESPF